MILLIRTGPKVNKSRRVVLIKSRPPRVIAIKIVLRRFSLLFRDGKIIRKSTVSPKGKVITAKPDFRIGLKPLSKNGSKLDRKSVV